MCDVRCEVELCVRGVVRGETSFQRAKADRLFQAVVQGGKVVSVIEAHNGSVQSKHTLAVGHGECAGACARQW